MTLYPPKQLTARLTDRREFNDKYHLLIFELTGTENRMPFHAGQYVSIQVSDRGDRRSYSIVSSPEITHSFELLIYVSPDGMGSAFLKNLNFGDEVHFIGPMGRFILNSETRTHTKPIVFIATGSGIAPFKSMLHELLQMRQARESLPESDSSEPRQITLHWGMRHESDLFWLDDMQDFMNSFSNFHFNPTLSQPTDEWTLSRGRVTDTFQVSTIPEDADFYICGNQGMIESVQEILIARGVGQDRIHYEKFY